MMGVDRIYKSDIQLVEEVFHVAQDESKSQEQRGKAAELLYDLGLLGSPRKILADNRIHLLRYTRLLRHAIFRLPEKGEEKVTHTMSDQDSRKVFAGSGDVEGTISEPTISAWELLQKYQTLEDTAIACSPRAGGGSSELYDSAKSLMNLLFGDLKSALAHHPDAEILAVGAACPASDDILSWKRGDAMIDLSIYLLRDVPGDYSDHAFRIAVTTMTAGGSQGGQ